MVQEITVSIAAYKIKVGTRINRYLPRMIVDIRLPTAVSPKSQMRRWFRQLLSENKKPTTASRAIAPYPSVNRSMGEISKPYKKFGSPGIPVVNRKVS
jgi:hypothetical protein